MTTQEPIVKKMKIENVLLESNENINLSDVNDNFYKSIQNLNPSNLLFMDDNGCPITSEDPYLKSSMLAIICKNPDQYTGDEKKGILGNDISSSSFNQIAKTIRTSQNTLCSGEISKAFFSDVENSIDVFILLYLLTIPGRVQNPNQRSARLIGFVCCKDLSQKNISTQDSKHLHVEKCDKSKDQDGGDGTSTNPGGKTLYIDAICAKLQLRGNEKKVDSEKFEGVDVSGLSNVDTGKIKIGVGKVLLSLVEQYALFNNFVQLKLSALGYVINYYKKMGYNHNCGCGSITIDSIQKASEKASKTIFKSEDQANLTYEVEKILNFLDRSRSNSDIENDFVVYIKKYLEKEGKSLNDFGLKDDSDKYKVNKMFKELPVPKGKSEFTYDLISKKDSINYFGYYDLVTLLIKNKFSVACEKGKKSERFMLKDNEGEEIFCGDEGFTMRKCLIDLSERINLGCKINETESTHFGGKLRKNNKKTKKKKFIKKNNHSKKKNKPYKKLNKSKKYKRTSKTN